MLLQGCVRRILVFCVSIKLSCHLHMLLLKCFTWKEYYFYIIFFFLNVCDVCFTYVICVQICKYTYFSFLFNVKTCLYSSIMTKICNEPCVVTIVSWWSCAIWKSNMHNIKLPFVLNENQYILCMNTYLLETVAKL